MIQVEIPDVFRQVLTEQRGENTFPRWVLEAVVIEAVREGLMTRGFGGELLGLGFHQREEFYSDHGLTYDLSDSEFEEDQKTLRRMFDH